MIGNYYHQSTKKEFVLTNAVTIVDENGVKHHGQPVDDIYRIVEFSYMWSPKDMNMIKVSVEDRTNERSI